jgi:hypothetical protein
MVEVYIRPSQPEQLALSEPSAEGNLHQRGDAMRADCSEEGLGAVRRHRGDLLRHHARQADPLRGVVGDSMPA